LPVPDALSQRDRRRGDRPQRPGRGQAPADAHHARDGGRLMAFKSLRDVNRRVVALISVTVLGAACALAFAVGELRLLERGYEMSGAFADTGGLKDGDDVRVAGVRVGRVLKVEPDFSQGHVVITWRVDAKVKLGLNTRADIQT